MDLNSEEGSSNGSSDADMEDTDFTKEEDMQDFTLFRGKPYQDLTLDDLKEVEFNTIEEVNRFYNYYDEGPFPNDEGYDGASHSDDNNILTPARKSKHFLSEPASFLQAPILESLRFLLNHIHFANGNFKSAPEDKRKGYFEQVWCELLR